MKTIGIELYGSWESDMTSLAGFTVSIMPCASRVELYDGSIQGAEESCVWDQ